MALEPVEGSRCTLIVVQTPLFVKATKPVYSALSRLGGEWPEEGLNRYWRSLSGVSGVHLYWRVYIKPGDRGLVLGNGIALSRKKGL